MSDLKFKAAALLVVLAIALCIDRYVHKKHFYDLAVACYLTGALMIGIARYYA